MIPHPLSSFVVPKPKDNWRSWGDPDSPLLHVLCFADQAEQVSAFEAAGITATDSDFSWRGVGDISIIGPVVDQEAVLDGEEIVTPATFLPGWYVNVLVPEPVEVVEPEPPVDTPLTAAHFQAAIERHVDQVAQQRSYSSAVSLASYVASTIPQWKAEANAFVAWRDAVWVKALTELGKVQMGVRPAPESTGAFIGELPEIEWP